MRHKCPLSIKKQVVSPLAVMTILYWPTLLWNNMFSVSFKLKIWLCFRSLCGRITQKHLSLRSPSKCIIYNKISSSWSCNAAFKFSDNYYYVWLHQSLDSSKCFGSQWINPNSQNFQPDLIFLGQLKKQYKQQEYKLYGGHLMVGSILRCLSYPKQSRYPILFITNILSSNLSNSGEITVRKYIITEWPILK